MNKQKEDKWRIDGSQWRADGMSQAVPFDQFRRGAYSGVSMPVNSTHLDYDAALPAWLRARDVFAAEDANKASGVNCKTVKKYFSADLAASVGWGVSNWRLESVAVKPRDRAKKTGAKLKP